MNFTGHKVIGRGIALTSTFSWEVYHSMIESLPKLMPFYSNKSFINTNYIIIAKSTYRSSPAYEVLKLLEIEPKFIVMTPVIVRELIIPYPSSCFVGIKSNIQLYNKNIIEKIKSESTPSLNRILLIKRSRCRKFPNITSLYEIIQSVFDQYTINIYDDKVEYEYKKVLLMFYESFVIIGAHGAGLSNLIACRPNTVVVEVATINSRKCFHSLSDQLNLNYYKYVYNKSEENGDSEFFNINLLDFQLFLIQVRNGR